MSSNNPSNRDWIDISLKAATPLIVGAVIAWIGLFGDETLNKISHRQESARLITELQIRREQAESALRKDIFAQALEAFLLKSGKGGAEVKKLTPGEISKQLLRLELLALNFGDSLSLSPLFVEMRKDIDSAKNAIKLPDPQESKALHDEYDHLKRRLRSLARRVASSQISALSQHGLEKTVQIPLKTDTVPGDANDKQCNDTLYSKTEYSWPLDVVIEDFRRKKSGLVMDTLIEMIKDLPPTEAADSQLDDLRKVLEKSINEVGATMVGETLSGSQDMGRIVNSLALTVKPVLNKSLTDLGPDMKNLAEDLKRRLEDIQGDRNFFDNEWKKLSSFRFQNKTRYVSLTVSNVNHCNSSLNLEIVVADSFEDMEAAKGTRRYFRLDYFNFPVVDNTRLSDNHRLALVIDDIVTGGAPYIELSTVIFPAEYASLRDRPGMEEARQMLDTAMDHASISSREDQLDMEQAGKMLESALDDSSVLVDSRGELESLRDMLENKLKETPTAETIEEVRSALETMLRDRKTVDSEREEIEKLRQLLDSALNENPGYKR